MKALRKWVVILGYTVLAMTVVSPTAFSSSSASSARAFVQSIAQTAFGVMHKADREEADREFAQGFYMPGFAKRCLVDHWDEITKEQQAEFIEVFTCTLRKKLASVITDRLKDKRFTYSIGKARRAKGGIVTVTLHAKINGANIDFVYFIVKLGKSYMLVDYEADGALLSRQYQGHFNFLMDKYGFDGMLDRMRKKFVECNIGS
ncbi:MAG: ABC transporter substrate-binding protein [Pseudomonadota bacterium]